MRIADSSTSPPSLSSEFNAVTLCCSRSAHSSHSRPFRCSVQSNLSRSIIQGRVQSRLCRESGDDELKVTLEDPIGLYAASHLEVMVAYFLELVPLVELLRFGVVFPDTEPHCLEALLDGVVEGRCHEFGSDTATVCFGIRVDALQLDGVRWLDLEAWLIRRSVELDKSE